MNRPMQYKKITAIIRKGRLEAVERALETLGVKGITVSRVKGFGEYANFWERDWMSENARIEIFAQANEVKALVEHIVEAAHTGHAGDGLVAVLPVEDIYRIRTRRPATGEEV